MLYGYCITFAYWQLLHLLTNLRIVSCLKRLVHVSPALTFPKANVLSQQCEPGIWQLFGKTCKHHPRKAISMSTPPWTSWEGQFKYRSNDINIIISYKLRWKQYIRKCTSLPGKKIRRWETADMGKLIKPIVNSCLSNIHAQDRTISEKLFTMGVNYIQGDVRFWFSTCFETKNFLFR